MSKQTKNILIIGFVVILVAIAAALAYNNNLNNKNKILNQDNYAYNATNTNATNTEGNLINENTETNMNEQNTNNQADEQAVYNTAMLKTSMGDITFEFSKDKPFTTSNFIKLAKEGFYNGVKFHRVIEDFMIQTGDPLSKDENKKNFWGTGDPGYKFNDELVGNETYQIGTVAMANSGPNTNGSQFFIMTSNTQLPPLYTVFGKVTVGQDVAQKIQSVATDAKDRPLENIIINSVELK